MLTERDLLNDLNSRSGREFVNLQQVEKYLDESILDVLLDWLTSRIDRNTRYELVRITSGKKTIEYTADRLLVIYRNWDAEDEDRPLSLRWSIMAHLANVAPRRLRWELADIVDDPSFGLSKAVAVLAAARGNHVDPELVPRLIRWTHLEVGSANLMAARVLGRWRVKKAREAIVDLLSTVDERLPEDNRPEERAELRRVLKRIDGE